MTTQQQQSDLKIEALKQRLGQREMETSEEIATLRVSITILAEQINKLQEENKELKGSVDVKAETVSTSDTTE